MTACASLAEALSSSGSPFPHSDTEGYGCDVHTF